MLRKILIATTVAFSPAAYADAHVHIELWQNENVLDPSAQIQLIAAPN